MVSHVFERITITWKYILAENCQAKGVNYVTSARGFLVSCCGSSHINIKLPNLLSHLQSPYTKVLLWSLYRKQTLAGLVAQFDSLSAVKNGSSIIILKSLSMNLSNEKHKHTMFPGNWYFNSHFVLKTTTTASFVFFTEIL